MWNTWVEINPETARVLGFSDRAAFAGVLLTHLREVQAHYASLFEHSAPGHELFRLGFSTDTENRETLDQLASSCSPEIESQRQCIDEHPHHTLSACASLQPT